MNSPLATVIASRSAKPRPPGVNLGGMVLHTTGSGLLDGARKAKTSPEEFAVAFYSRQSPAYPHYLCAHDGDLYAFAREDRVAPHAGWKAWERAAYTAAQQPWARIWARDFADDRVAVEPSFYAAWDDHWPFWTPAEMLRVVGGATAQSPNDCTIGVEILAHPSGRFTEAQHRSVARLFADCARRNDWLDPAEIERDTLPQPWLCGHSDFGPCRRWQRTKADRARGVKAVPAQGYGWDPGDALDWNILRTLIVEEARKP